MKRLPKTDFINQLLASTVGADVDTTNHAVYEIVATSTVPLRGKTGTIFENAVIEASTLYQLANSVNRDALPLMMDHNMEGAPFGKYFYAEVMPNEFGHTELRGYGYVDPTEEKTMAKLDNGTIDETSIAFAATEMRCSDCGWDYAKAIEEDNIMPLITRTCENGHQIGKNGNHLKLIGVKDAMELSLVSRGAAKNSKIIGQSESKLGKQLERLAAHGLDISDLYVTASASQGNDDMEMKELIIQLSDAKADKAVAEKSVERLERELAEARGKQNEAETKARELETDLADARSREATQMTAEEVEQAEKDSKSTKASVEFLTKQYTAVMAAAGTPVEDDNIPSDVEGLIEGIKSKHSDLSAILPIDGVSLSANHQEDIKPKQDFTVFRPVTPKHKR